MKDDASTISLPSTSRRTPDGLRDPAIEAWRTPPSAAKISTISKLDYEVYTALQAEVSQLIEQSSAAEASSPGASKVGPYPVQGPPKARFETGSIHFSDADVASSYASAIRALEQLSLVRPDHTDEDEIIWDINARKLQRWARKCLARMELRRRQRRLAEHFARVAAVVQIETIVAHFLERKIALAVLNKKRAERQRLLNFTWAATLSTAGVLKRRLS